LQPEPLAQPLASSLSVHRSCRCFPEFLAVRVGVSATLFEPSLLASGVPLLEFSDGDLYPVFLKFLLALGKRDQPCPLEIRFYLLAQSLGSLAIPIVVPFQTMAS